MKVRDVMTKSPTVCTPDTSLQEVARMMRECDCGAIPVVTDVESRHPIGVVTDRDIVVRCVASGNNPLVGVARDCMTSPVVSVREDADVDDALHTLEEKQIRRILVIDDRGACTGIIAQADLAKSVSKRDTGELVRAISRSPMQDASMLT